MYSFMNMKEMPAASAFFAYYASFSAFLMLFRSVANDLIPESLRHYLYAAVSRFLFRRPSDTLTLIVEEGTPISPNELYDSSLTYLRTKINPTAADRLRISKFPKDKHFTLSFDKAQLIADFFDGVDLQWRFMVCRDPSLSNNGGGGRRYSGSSSSDDEYEYGVQSRFFELTFPRSSRDMIVDSYLPFVIERAKQIVREHKVLKLYTLESRYRGGDVYWDTVKLEHPSTFETLAMEPDIKRVIVEDLDRFVRRKDFYRRVGRAWKRGYLLYGPPGTGKSSLIAAIANYLKFDIYDLQLDQLRRDSDLRRLLLSTSNRSIILIEDIDCGIELPSRENSDKHKFDQPTQLTLAGLLNFIDGLWSTCGDERIIVVTTNHKDKIDPALLRPGRMDMHIHMSYLTNNGFKILAANYLGISQHPLFDEIETLMEAARVTPAQVAEELMRSEDVDVAILGVYNLLKLKEGKEDIGGGEGGVECLGVAEKHESAESSAVA